MVQSSVGNCKLMVRVAHESEDDSSLPAAYYLQTPSAMYRHLVHSQLHLLLLPPLLLHWLKTFRPRELRR